MLDDVFAFDTLRITILNFLYCILLYHILCLEIMKVKLNLNILTTVYCV